LKYFDTWSNSIRIGRYKRTSWESAGGKDSPPFALAPDGKRFAVVLNADGTADENTFTHLTVLLNFFDELRRRVPAGGK
jgi:hypothetical protein